jgi:ATP adenylyltransferase
MDRVYAPWRSIYLRADKSGECLFCELSREEISKDKWILFKGTNWFIVVNIYPYTSGHIMIVCNRHVEKFNDLTEDENKEMTELISRCEDALTQAYNPMGINFGANLGQIAGAGIVGHLHIHLVPRWHGDTNFMTSVGETRVVSEGLSETYDRLIKLFK